MANPRNKSTTRLALEQRNPLNSPVELNDRSNHTSATRVSAHPRQPAHFHQPASPHGPPIPTYIPNPFEETMPVRSTAELGPDPYPVRNTHCSQGPHLNSNISGPYPPLDFLSGHPRSRNHHTSTMSAESPPSYLHTGESSTQSDERSTTRTAHMEAALRLPQQANALPVVQQTVPPTRAHTGPNTTASQRSPIQPQFRITSGPRNRPQVTRPVVQATRAIRSTGQRRSGQTLSNPAQRPSNNSVHQSNFTPTGLGIAPPSVSHEPFGEGFHRAFEVFNQPFFQNRGSATTSGSADVSVPSVEVHRGSGTTYMIGRLLSQHGPTTSTTTGLDNLPPDARSGVMRAMELAANLTGQNFNQTAQLQEAPASSRSRHFPGGSLVSSARLSQELATAVNTAREASQSVDALSQQVDVLSQGVDSTAEELRTLRTLQTLRTLRTHRHCHAPPPAHIEHFTALPTDNTSTAADCIICQEPYDNNEHAAIQLRNVTCTHIFGRACLQKWVNSRMANAHRCPSCRQDISGAFAHAAETPQSAAVNDHEVPSRRPVRVGYSGLLQNATRREVNDRLRAELEVLDARHAELEAENRAEALDGVFAGSLNEAFAQDLRVTLPTIAQATADGIRGEAAAAVRREEMVMRKEVAARFNVSVARNLNERATMGNRHAEQFRSVSRRAARENREREAENATLRH
jgi:hypothetical protein